MSQLLTFCSVSFRLASGHHRGVQQEPRCQRGRRHRQVQGGQRQVSQAIRDAGGGEAGQLLLLQLLEGQGAATGMALPQHQPPLLLLLLTRKRRLDIDYLCVCCPIFLLLLLLILLYFFTHLYFCWCLQAKWVCWHRTVTVLQQDLSLKYVMTDTLEVQCIYGTFYPAFYMLLVLYSSGEGQILHTIYFFNNYNPVVLAFVGLPAAFFFFTSSQILKIIIHPVPTYLGFCSGIKRQSASTENVLLVFLGILANKIELKDKPRQEENDKPIFLTTLLTTLVFSLRTPFV